jgi:hypothetical protein
MKRQISTQIADEALFAFEKEVLNEVTNISS